MTNPRIVTFGCRLNHYESEVMRDHAKKAGLENAIIVNTCAVTMESEHKSRQALSNMRRTYPNAVVVLCAHQQDVGTARAGWLVSVRS